MKNETRGRVVVVAEHRQGRLVPITYELIACAREIRDLTDCEILVGVLGEQITELAGEIAARSGERVVAIQGPALALYNAEMHKYALEEFIHEISPAYVCVAHTAQGLDFAPGLAVRLHADCITGVERVAVEQNRLRFFRSACDGKYQLEVESRTETTVFTVLAQAYAPTICEGRHGSMATREFTAVPSRTRTIGFARKHESSPALVSAKVIIAGGRGVGPPEAMVEIQRLAATFPGAAIAGSRPVCDMGWLPYAYQVGVTGATVAPDLYIACGISGSRQHTVGMAASKFIVAISLDPRAPFFQFADIGIVDNLHRFVPALAANIENRRSK